MKESKNSSYSIYPPEGQGLRRAYAAVAPIPATGLNSMSDSDAVLAYLAFPQALLQNTALPEGLDALSQHLKLPVTERGILMSIGTAASAELHKKMPRKAVSISGGKDHAACSAFINKQR